AAGGADELARHQLHVPIDAGDADAVVARRPDDAGDVGAVARVVHRVVVVVVEVPADYVVDVPVVVVVDAVGPAATADGRREVGAVDEAVVVDVDDLAGADVARVVEIAEGDDSVAVHVDQSGADGGGNLALVDPDVLIQVGVVVVHPGVHQSDDELARSGRAV